MNKEYLTRLIYDYNPQLNGKDIAVPSFKRDLFNTILQWIEKKQMIAITGLRRVGKSVLMKQLMREVENPAFFSFDEEETQNKDTLVFILDFFLNNLKSKFIFLDEIQYIDDWQGILKRYYDTKNIKFFISGSESLEITRAKESLAGRIITFNLEIMNFKEYLELKGKKVDFKNSLEETYNILLPEKEFFEFEFLNYLYNGAFPELIHEKNDEIIRKCLNELVVKKIIYRDLPRIFEIKRNDLLFELFKYASNNTSYLFEIDKLCALFKADFETIKTYLFYLEKSFLIKIAEVYSESAAKKIRKNKKIYVVHPSIAFAILRYNREMLVGKILGQYVESLFGGRFFWRDKHKVEVDVVIDGFPIEIKYQNNLNREDFKGIFRFFDLFKPQKGFIVTKNIFKEEILEGKKIFIYPAWFFSLFNDKIFGQRIE